MSYELVLTLKLASISLKAFVFPLRAVQTRLNRDRKTETQNVIKIIPEITDEWAFLIRLPFVLIQQIFVSY